MAGGLVKHRLIRVRPLEIRLLRSTPGITLDDEWPGIYHLPYNVKVKGRVAESG